MPQRKQTLKPPNALSSSSSASSSSSRWVLWVVVPVLIVASSVFLPDLFSAGGTENKKIEKDSGGRIPKKVDVDEASFFASRKECPKLNPLLGI